MRKLESSVGVISAASSSDVRIGGNSASIVTRWRWMASSATPASNFGRMILAPPAYCAASSMARPATWNSGNTPKLTSSAVSDHERMSWMLFAIRFACERSAPRGRPPTAAVWIMTRPASASECGAGREVPSVAPSKSVKDAKGATWAPIPYQRSIIGRLACAACSSGWLAASAIRIFGAASATTYATSSALSRQFTGTRMAPSRATAP